MMPDRHAAGARIAETLEAGGDDRDAGVGELGKQQRFDAALQPARDPLL